MLSHVQMPAQGTASMLCSTTIWNHLREKDTRPTLLQTLPKLPSLVNASEPIHVHLFPVAVQKALQAQTAVGWHIFLIRCWSAEWFSLQIKH